MNIYNLDCFEFFENYEGDKIDLVVVDLPYGQTVKEWDIKIDLKRMWKNLFKICEQNCIFCFFTTTKYGIELINSNERYFRYDLVWEKESTVGYLSANKIPLRTHEMIYIFSKPNNDDIEIKLNKDLREYSKKLFEWINKPTKEISKKQGHRGLDHFSRWNTLQFGIPHNKNYQFLIDEYKINEFKDFLTYDEIREKKWEKNENKKTYNPQKTKGKPYKTKGSIRKSLCNYKKEPYGMTPTNNKGDRFPKSILKFGYDKEKLHTTQKPVALCEWLIKTYSNENGLVLDFCMGSGSTGVACANTNRRFIGIEKDEKIFEIAKKRLNL